MSTENNIKLCDVMCENEIVIHLVSVFALFFVFFVLDHLLRGAQVQFLLCLTLIRDFLCLLPTLTYSVFYKNWHYLLLLLINLHYSFKDLK